MFSNFPEVASQSLDLKPNLSDTQSAGWPSSRLCYRRHGSLLARCVLILISMRVTGSTLRRTRMQDREQSVGQGCREITEPFIQRKIRTRKREAERSTGW